MDNKTPNAKHSRAGLGYASSPEAGNFSPCVVSPGRSPLHGNLTGTARRVKDCCADLHSATQKWNTHRTRGVETINEIANIKLQAIYAKEQSAGDVEVKQPVAEMPQEMEPLCNKLLETVEAMSKLVEKMRAVSSAFSGVCNLEWHQFNQSFSEEPLFQTWPIHLFDENCEELLRMYDKELQLKRTIAQNVAHADSRQMLMFYTASWLHEPYIEDRAKLLLESMLKETGHR